MAVISSEKTKDKKTYFYEQYSQEKIMEKMRRYLSDRLYFEIMTAITQYGQVEEIRLRRDKCVYLTVGAFGKKKNISTDIILSGEEISNVFERMCDGSLYAYSESIINGYISLPFGIRVGVCGRAAVEKEKIFGIYDVSGLNIRIPSLNIHTDVNLLNLVKNNICIGQGVLIFSPPAQGKTTCLRSIAYELAVEKMPMRVAAVDSRNELLFMPENKNLSLDLLVGYPKAEGIRIATLFMNPEVIICDEIGTDEEALAIVNAQNCGVPLVATTHASTLSSVMLKKGIVALHKACVFGCYISLRIARDGVFSYTSYSWEEAEQALEDNRRSYDSV